MLNVKVIIMGEMNDNYRQVAETQYFIDAVNAGIAKDGQFFVQTNGKEFAGKSGEAIDLSGCKTEHKFPAGDIKVLQWEGNIYIVNRVGLEWRPEAWSVKF